ncbi:hypothetical protein ACUP6R_004004 [Vibrio navarrensis]
MAFVFCGKFSELGGVRKLWYCVAHHLSGRYVLGVSLKFQRDKISLSVVIKLFSKLKSALFFKIKGNRKEFEWQLICVADCLRILGMLKLASWLAIKISNSTLIKKHMFWSLHVAAVAFHYAEKYSIAKHLFETSQIYSCEISLSFSFQHLGKLNTELGNYDLAERQFSQALAIRQSHNKPELISSSESALLGLQKLRT